MLDFIGKRARADATGVNPESAILEAASRESASRESENLERALAEIRRVAAGDFEARLTHITATGDLGELLHAVNDVIDQCDAYVRESGACMQHVQQKQFFRKIVETGMQGSFLNAAQTVNAALQTMQQQVEDFTEITRNFESTVGTVVQTISSASSQLAGSSEAMRSVADDTSERAAIVAKSANDASANVESVSAASEELSASITEISQQVSMAARVAGEAASLSENMSVEVRELEGATNQIQAVVELIHSIARQTNLLALNATIEAARAGDAGKGFAVVATEVKTLARQTADATQKIGDLARSMQQASQSTVKSISGLSDKVVEITSTNNSVSAAVEEQTSATSEIARNILEAYNGTTIVKEHIGAVTEASEKTGEAAAQVNVAARDLAGQSEKLSDVTAEFLVAVRAVI